MKYLILVMFIFVQLFSAQNSEKVALQLQWYHQFQFAGYYMAKEKGFYEDAGLDVELKEYELNLDPVEQVMSKKANYAIGRSSLIIDSSKGKGVVALAAILQSSPLILVARSDSDIRNIEDLNGKRVGGDHATINTVSILAMLKKENIVVNYTPGDNTKSNIENLLDGDVDVISAYISNEIYTLIHTNVKYIVFNPKNYKFNFYSDILFSSKDELNTHPQRTRNFKNASLKGWEYAFSNIDETVQLILDKYNTQNKTREALTFEANKLKELAYYKTNKIGKIDNDKIKNIYSTYKNLGFIENSIDLNKFIFRENNTPTVRFTKEETAYLKAKKEITVCGQKDSLPYANFTGEKARGIIPDFIDRYESIIGIPIKYVKTDNWNQCMVKTKNREIDIADIILKKPNIIPYLTPTNTYMSDFLIFVSKIEKPYISDISNIDNMNFAIGETYKNIVNYVKKKYPNLDLLYVKDRKEGLQKVFDGKVDAYIDVFMPTTFMINKQYIKELKINGRFTEFDLEGAFGVRSDEPLLVSILNKAIDALEPVKKREIINSWISVEQKKEFDYNLYLKILWVLLILLLIFSYRQYILKRENKKLQAAYVENDILNERMELAFAGSNDGLWDWDIISDTLYLSERWKEILGYKDYELENNLSSWQDRVHPDDLEQALYDIQLNADGKTDLYENKHRIRHKDGHWVWILDRGKTMFKDGQAIRMVGTQTDITKEKEKEFKLIHQGLIIEQITDSVISTDLDGYIMHTNEGSEILLGYSHDELIGEHISILYDQEDMAALQENIKTLMQTGKFRTEVCLLKKSKEIVPVALSLSLLRDENGIPVRMVGYAHDQTQQKKSEEILQKLNNTLEEQKNTFKNEAKRFQDILNQIPEIAIQGYDEQHRVIFWNHASEDIYGYSHHEALGKKIEDLIIPDIMHEAVNEAISNWINKDIKIPSAEVILKDKNNHPVYVFSQHVLIDTIRGTKEMYCLDIDLHHIKETEEKLKKSEQALQMLNMNLEEEIEIALADLKKSQKQARLGSWKLDIVNNKLSWSDETYHIFEHTKVSDFIAMEDFLAAIHPDDTERVNVAYSKSLENKEPYEVMHKILMKDGRIKHVREHCETTFDSDGNALVSVGTIQDITGQYLAEEKLQEKKDMLFKQSRLAQMGEMISMIAHQWRQPLSAISATTNALILKNERGGYESELFEDRLQKIANYAQHLSITIDDFRNFFKANKEKEETMIETVMQDVLAITQPLLESKNINVITDFNYHKKVYIYANEIKQVLLNLIKNAEDILLENKVVKPEITLRTFEENGYAILSVEDNGGGIDKAIIDKIFDPYFSTKLDKEGTGLGLYMSKMIVQEHCAGTLGVENGPNGAIFKIKIRTKISK